MEIEREGEREREREKGERAWQKEVGKPIGGRKSGYEVKRRGGEEMKEQDGKRKVTGGHEM